MRHLGFTGTREAVTQRQEANLFDKLAYFQDIDYGVLHHGRCVGADAVADQMARSLGYEIVLHPPVNISKMAYCEPGPNDWQPKPFLERNKDIVDCSEIMLACPKGPEEIRSGTWSTIRYAKNLGRQCYIFWPNGRVEITSTVFEQ